MDTDETQRICVTGGAGFIGSHLVRALRDRGNAVTVLDDLSVGRRDWLPEDVRLVVGDIRDCNAASHAVRDCHAVAHLAARVAVRSSFDYAVEDASVNLVGTANLLKAAADAGCVRRFVGASSMAVYADSSDARPMSEDHPTEAISPYGVSKLASERLVHLMCARFGMKSVMLRLFNTYGPGQAVSPYVGVVTIFVNKLGKGEQPAIYGDGAQCRDFVHVADVSDAIVAALESDVTGRTFNIGTGVAESVNHVYEHVRLALGSSTPPRYEPAIPGELRYAIADIGAAREALGFEPRRRFEIEIARVVRDISDSIGT